MRTRMYWLIFLLFLVAPQAYPQSYEETEAFILRKYSGTFGDSSLATTISVVFPERCKAMFTIDNNFFKLGRNHLDALVDFRHVDPTRIKWEPSSGRSSQIKLFATDDKDTLTYIYGETSVYPPGSRTRAVPSVTMDFSLDERVGQQLERALKHLTQLCGGKSEIF